jgi:predicted AAA+ superfamily ATPase
MITRLSENKINDLLNGFPCVALIGPRQVGKTTLAKQI